MVPRGVVWLRVYGVMMALGCLLCVGHAGVFIWAIVAGPPQANPPPPGFIAFPIAYGSVALVAALACVVAPWLLPRNQWGWAAGLLMVAAGMTGGPCCWLVVAPMVWLWCEADTRVYFGMHV